MKKLSLVLGIFILLFIGVFVWLLSQTSADHAPKEVVTIDLPDVYEK